MHSRDTRFIATVIALTFAVAACGSDAEPVADASNATVGAGSTSTIAQSIDSAPSTTGLATAAEVAASTTAPSTVAAAATTTAAPTTTAYVFPPAPRVILIGDSTLQAVGRYQKLPVLLGMDPVYEARSCRLLAIPSCGENPATNTVEVLDTAEGAFDMVVIMAGYDEWYESFADSFDQVVAHSRAKGAKRVIWLSYQEAVDYVLPDGTPGNGSLVNINQIMRDKVASGGYPDVVIADWFQYAKAQAGWFNKDDIHLSPTGAIGVADYISRKVAFIASLPCPMPREPGGTIEPICSDPDVAGPVLDVAALYET